MEEGEGEAVQPFLLFYFYSIFAPRKSIPVFYDFSNSISATRSRWGNVEEEEGEKLFVDVSFISYDKIKFVFNYISVQKFFSFLRLNFGRFLTVRFLGRPVCASS